MFENVKRKSIRFKIIIEFTILTTVFLFIIISSISYFFLDNIKEDSQVSMYKKANSIEDKIEERLEYLINTTELLSKNSLMINSLIDEDGRQEYLNPLANNFMEDKNVVYLNIVDFHGRVIFQTSESVLKYDESINLRQALAIGETSYYIDELSGNVIIVSPMKYYDTTQGALIASFNLKEIFEKYLFKSEGEYIKIFTLNNKLVYSNGFFKENKYHTFNLIPNENTIFSKLGIKLELGTLESLYLKPLESAILNIVIVGLLLLFFGNIIAYFWATRITRPILRLYEKVMKKEYENTYVPMGTNDEIEALDIAFYEKTNELYKSEQLLNTVINDIQDLIFFKDKDFKYIGCNDSFLEFVGKSKEEIIGHDDFELFDNNTASLFREMDVKMLEENQGRFNSEWVVYPDETKHYLQTLKTPFEYERDQFGVLGISRDITELDKLQKEEIEKQKILFQQSKLASMGDMIGNIAHQWRQPLSVISTSATGVQMKKDFGILDDEFLDDTMKLIDKNAQYLSKTIDTFREFLREKKEYSEVVLQTRIEKALEIVETTLRNHHIKLINEINDVEPVNVNLIVGELSQVIINIINNSKDAIVENNIENPWIKISLELLEKEVLIIIEDNGGGIPEDVLPNIFKAYFTTKPDDKGTGLGLHMSYKIIVESLNGDIYANNTEYGARFFIKLPKL